jgi:hypothetical protein
MKIRIVCYEDPDKWILGKFAKKLNLHLRLMGIESDIDNKPDPLAHINHHIIFSNYEGLNGFTDTLMITHVDNIDKLNLLKRSLKTAKLGICMSSETMFALADSGIDRKNLCYINPSHDEAVVVNKVVIGIFCRVQPDGRKRESFITKLAKKLDSSIFKFIIMGDSWETQISDLINEGFEVDYYNKFELQLYYNLFQNLDYYLYMGMDEGQMGVLDAHAAGVKTIVTSQGYHLDLDESITHPFTTFDDLYDILFKIQLDKLRLLHSVKKLNWESYTLKHLECWKYVLNNEIKLSSTFKDGFNSIFSDQDREINLSLSYFNLLLNKYIHYFFIIKNKYYRLFNK